MTTTRTNTPDHVTHNEHGHKTTRITTKRACNGCGALLGDITAREMNAAIAGAPLPDVRSECPTCAPTAPDPACQPTKILAGDLLCLDHECDHGPDDRPVDAHCDEVREDTVCATHSTFVAAEDGFDEITHAEPWPCQHNAKPTG